VEINVPTPLGDAVAAVWRARALDDRGLQEPGAQDGFRRALAADLGRAYTDWTDAVRAALAAPPHAVVVRDRGPGRAAALLAALAVALGEMMNPYRDLVPGSPVLQEIVPKGPSSPDRVWLWHTDSANWPEPNDLSALACLRAAPVGGATQVLSLATLRAHPAWRADLLAPLWEAEVEWPVDSFLGGGTFRARAITADRLRFRRELLAGRGSGAFQRAVDGFAAASDAAAPDVSALLRPGDVLVFDNRRAMHRAGPVRDPQRRRRLLRTKIRQRPGRWRHL